MKNRRWSNTDRPRMRWKKGDASIRVQWRVWENVIFKSVRYLSMKTVKNIKIMLPPVIACDRTCMYGMRQLLLCEFRSSAFTASSIDFSFSSRHPVKCTTHLRYWLFRYDEHCTFVCVCAFVPRWHMRHAAKLHSVDQLPMLCLWHAKMENVSSFAEQKHTQTHTLWLGLVLIYFRVTIHQKNVVRVPWAEHFLFRCAVAIASARARG